jgi:ribulose 1,5-bisphosphate synthetase/thiazole synthase
MRAIGFIVALTVLPFALAPVAVVDAEERIEGTVVSTTLTSCEFKPGTCEGSLVLDTKGKDGQVTVKVPKGTPIKKGNDPVFLPGLKGSQVAIAYTSDKGQRMATSIEVKSAKP